MVRQWQELFYDRRYSFTELPPVEFVKIGQAYGIDGIRVESCDEVMPALKAAVDCDGPFVWTSGSSGKRTSSRWSRPVLRSTR